MHLRLEKGIARLTHNRRASFRRLIAGRTDRRKIKFRHGSNAESLAAIRRKV